MCAIKINLQAAPIELPEAPVKSPEISPEHKVAQEQGWNVVVHNDPVNLMSYVALVFRRVFGYSRAKSEHHMLQVHHRGRSILWTGGKEKAELYVQQLHGYLLLATLERA